MGMPPICDGLSQDRRRTLQMLLTSIHLMFHNIPSLLFSCRSLFEISVASVFDSAQSFLTLGSGSLSVMRPISSREHRRRSPVWRWQETQTLFSTASYDQWFTQKRISSLVWVTWYWALVELWHISSALRHHYSWLLCGTGLTGKTGWSALWTRRNVESMSGCTHTGMSNQISQEETFKNGYRPLLKLNKIKYLCVMMVLTYEL